MHELDNMQDLDRFVQNFTKIVIEFHANWCAPCRRIAPQFEVCDRKYFFSILNRNVLELTHKSLFNKN